MTTATFQTENYGRIEVTEKVAYFAKDDMEAEVNNHLFQHPFSGTTFNVIWPAFNPHKKEDKKASLYVWQPRRIGEVEIK